MTQPTSLGIICWLLIILSAMTALSTLWTFHGVSMSPQVVALLSKSPLSLRMQELLALLGCIIRITAGVLMLRCVAAGRLLYVVWGAFGILFALLTSPVVAFAISSIVTYAVIVFFLFRRPVSAWLRADAPA